MTFTKAAIAQSVLKLALSFFRPSRFLGGKSGMAAVLGALLLTGCAGPSNYQSATSHKRIVIDADKRGEMVMTALSMLNTPYRYGGDNPSKGFDCSGLVAYVVDRIANQHLPHNAASIAQTTRFINREDLKAGDLVFFNTLHRPYSHVGIYLGDGLFINAPSSGGQVRIDALSNRYYARRFDGAGTFFTD